MKHKILRCLIVIVTWAFSASSVWAQPDGSPCASAVVYDVDGYVYHTVQIGRQCWMRENLKTTHYADGTSIPVALNREKSDVKGYLFYPDGHAENVEQYGFLYNWPAARGGQVTAGEGAQGICPKGWHLPAEKEFMTLINYVGSQPSYYCEGDSNFIGKALASTEMWDSYAYAGDCVIGNHRENNNATGFNAIPAGGWHGGRCVDFNRYADIWTSSLNGALGVYHRLLYYLPYAFMYDAETFSAFSVRCLKTEN